MGSFRGEGVPFVKVIHLYGTDTGGSGASYESPLPFVDGDLWAIPAGTLITHCYAIIDTAITGTTDLDVGDDDQSDDFIDGSASLTLGTPGMYGYDTKVAGAYLKTTTGSTDYITPNAKFYSAAGKELKLNVTTANTAGRMRVVVQGYIFPEV
jgi:hypothetical protein